MTEQFCVQLNESARLSMLRTPTQAIPDKQDHEPWTGTADGEGMIGGIARDTHPVMLRT
jgi:hypothetical protein